MGHKLMKLKIISLMSLPNQSLERNPKEQNKTREKKGEKLEKQK